MRKAIDEVRRRYTWVSVNVSEKVGRFLGLAVGYSFDELGVLP
jgi:hypothetical protein